MNRLSPVLDLDAEDEREVVVAGDWHSNTLHVMNVFDRIRKHAPDARYVLQLGDFNLGSSDYSSMFLNTVNRACEARDLQVLIVPGNHDHYGRLATRNDWQSGRPAQVHSHVRVLQQGTRFEIGGKSFVVFSGAASLDRLQRRPGVDWWPEEMPAHDDVEHVSGAGFANVMLTHEAVDGATSATDFIDADRNPHRWPEVTLAESALSRKRVTDVWNRVHPDVLFHGHLHASGAAVQVDGRRVYALDQDKRPGNVGVLALDDLGWRILRGP